MTFSFQTYTIAVETEFNNIKESKEGPLQTLIFVLMVWISHELNGEGGSKKMKIESKRPRLREEARF